MIKDRTFDEIFRTMPRELMLDLVAAIFLKARSDYITNADGKRRDAEIFFRSDWAQELSLKGFEPENVLRMMDEEIKDGHR